ncbi:WAT1-related protein At4g28040 [Manihot esculenta]|uniref:WAT1-related protein n=1 Tax=Manihot esculenta TaxID=3983 RepID=A0A2C9UM70_MANES|nr:WAT1-related protein At4g28040 [Manihot esculenta]OAY32066.1 hypothetical protein MANES_14G163600v8 [Manihot esculenta]
MGSFDECKPVMAMIGIQFVYAGLALLSRAAFLQGLNPWVFVVYRQGIGTLIMAPLVCLSSRRNSCWSSFGFRSFAWIFLASLIGVTANQISYFEGLYLTSSTVGTAMSNLIPAITFVLAIISGLEKVNTFSLRSMAKILGTVVCVSGAISMAFLKGPKLLNTKSPPLKSFSNHGGDYWLLGCLLLFGSSSFWSLWMLFQIPISASCPDHLASSALMGLLATIESAIVTFFLGKDLAAWHLNSFLEIGCCLFGGIAMALSFFVQAWCISQRGPVFTAMFNPLCTVIVTVVAAIFLQEQTYVGSLIGALAVIIGLYVVLWGKAKDFKELKMEMHKKLREDESRTVEVIIDKSLEKKNCKADDLKEPLLSLKSADDDKNCTTS